jgi:AmiR/NasT family two-component response regulator
VFNTAHSGSSPAYGGNIAIVMDAAEVASIGAARLERTAADFEALRAEFELTRAELARTRDQVTNLKVALQTSRCIGMAVGILMSRRGLTEKDAFHTLRRVSQQTNRKLRDVAEHVVYVGDLPVA